MGQHSSHKCPAAGLLSFQSLKSRCYRMGNMALTHILSPVAAIQLLKQKEVHFLRFFLNAGQCTIFQSTSSYNVSTQFCLSFLNSELLSSFKTSTIILCAIFSSSAYLRLLIKVPTNHIACHSINLMMMLSQYREN